MFRYTDLSQRENSRQFVGFYDARQKTCGRAERRRTGSAAVSSALEASLADRNLRLPQCDTKAPRSEVLAKETGERQHTNVAGQRVAVVGSGASARTLLVNAIATGQTGAAGSDGMGSAPVACTADGRYRRTRA
jgi:hypothetical protein